MDEADAARADIATAQPGLLWLPIAGLDRHTPMIGLAPLPALASARFPSHDQGPRMQAGIYRPICDVMHAPRA